MESKKCLSDVLMLNRDPNWYRFIDGSSKEACQKSMEDFFSLYEGAITDIAICVFEQTALVPNNYITWRGDKYLQKKENGIDVDYSDNPVAKLYRAYAELGVDPVAIFIDRVSAKGIRPWVTFRMNDVHFAKEETSFLRSELFYEEREAGHLVHGEYRFHPAVFDFTYPRYRNALLGYIEEVLARYDFFGVELDFMREYVCFDYKNDPDCHLIMTEYIREIRAAVKRAEARVGHEIRLSVRVPRSPKDALAMGFDVKTWVGEGLVDAVVPTPHWNPTDSAVPIREWRALLGDDIALFGGIEANSFGFSVNKAESSKAYAAAFYAMGADGIYFNNHEYYTDRNRAAWRITRKSCLEGRREFIVNYQDCCAYPEWRYRPLPLSVDGSAALELEIGEVKTVDRVTVIADFEGEGEPWLEVCGVRAVGKPTAALTEMRGERQIEFTPHRPISFDISGVAADSAVTLAFHGCGTVHYVNIIIEA